MNTIERVKLMSEHELAGLGLAEIAYLRQAVIDGQPGYAIHSANGIVIGFAPNREIALGLMRDNDLEPVSLH